MEHRKVANKYFYIDFRFLYYTVKLCLVLIKILRPEFNEIMPFSYRWKCCCPMCIHGKNWHMPSITREPFHGAIISKMRCAKCSRWVFCITSCMNGLLFSGRMLSDNLGPVLLLRHKTVARMRLPMRVAKFRSMLSISFGVATLTLGES